MQKIVDRDKLWELIVAFEDQWHETPKGGFLAGYYGVSLQRIRDFLYEFEAQGKIRFIKKGQYNTTYKLIK